MKVLLINNTNPVVSRLTSLSARKEDIKLDEVKEISELKNSNYNIVFVDYDSLSQKVIDFLKESKIKKKVCFYAKDDNEKDIENIFDFKILKPFLPSEVSAIIRDCKIQIEKEMEEEKSIDKENMVSLDELISNKDDLKIIDIDKKEKIKDKPEIKEQKEELKADISTKEKVEVAIEDIVKTVEKVEPLKVSEEKKVEEKKESEKVKQQDVIVTPKQEEKIELDLEELKEETIKEEIKDISPSLKEEEKLKLEEPKEEIKLENSSVELFELDNEEKKDKKEDIELFELDSKEEVKTKESDDIFDFDAESKDELDFDITEAQKDNSTKILDKEEISNIKNLLNSEAPDDLSLDDILASSAPIDMSLPKKEKKKKKKKSKKIKKSIQENDKEVVEVFTDTIKALPVEELRQLLRGTKIYITIEFPDK